MERFTIDEIEALDYDMFEALIDSAIKEPFEVLSSSGEAVVFISATELNHMVDTLCEIVEMSDLYDKLVDPRDVI